jgi:predicted DNA-binding protein (UPF0251 family)
MRAKVVFYNEHTGEIYEEVDRTLFIGKQPYIKDKNFVKVFVAFLTDVLEDKELGKGAWRLLIYAIRNMDYNSLRLYMVPEEVAKTMGIDRATFYRWVKVLIKNGYLEKVATNVYRIKPYTAIKGTMEQTLKTEPDF